MQATWETFAEIEAASDAAGYSVSRDQLRRWRGMGLLPGVRQAGKGRSIGGSETRHPIGTAAQAIEIIRLLREKEKLAEVGWKLWMRGFPVCANHWRVPLEAAQNSILSVQSKLRASESQSDLSEEAETIYQHVDIEPLRGSPLYTAVSRIPQDIRPTILGLAADILLSRFQFTRVGNDVADGAELSAFRSVMGLSAALPTIFGTSLTFDRIETVLENLSCAMQLPDPINFCVDEPSIEARRDLANGQTIAVDLYHSTQWLFKGGFSLRTIERIVAKASVEIQAAMLLVWGRYREIDIQLESLHIVDKIARAATALRALADQLQAAMTALPAGHPLNNRAMIRRAISNPDLFGKFLNSISQIH